MVQYLSGLFTIALLIFLFVISIVLTLQVLDFSVSNWISGWYIDITESQLLYTLDS